MGIRSLLGELEGSTPSRRGLLGEDDVYRVLIAHSRLNNLHYKIIYNLNIVKPKAQIDMIYINKDGVFVIEVKNWTGRINGKEDDRYWDRLYQYKGHLKHVSYNNPVKQNEYHINALKQNFDINCPIFSIIVFASGNAHQINIPNVVNVTGLSRFLLNIESPVKLTDDDIDNLYLRLKV